MKKFPKLFAALLACAMALTLLTACQDANGNVVVPGAPASSTPTEAPMSAEDQILTQINQLRAANGKPDVQRNADLDALAESLMDVAIAGVDAMDNTGLNQAVSEKLSAQAIVINGQPMTLQTLKAYAGTGSSAGYPFDETSRVTTDATTTVGIAVRDVNGVTYFVIAAAIA